MAIGDPPFPLWWNYQIHPSLPQLTPIGWQCPVCKRVYAPHVDGCECDTENVNVSEWLDENGELARSD